MNFIDTTFSKFTPQAGAVLRIITGLLFLEHGSAKLLGFPAANMSPPLFSLSGVSGVLELAGGLLMVLGLFTRPVAFLLAGEMAVAYFIGHAPKGVFPMLNGGDAAILFCFVFLYFAAAGGGIWSVDAQRA